MTDNTSSARPSELRTFAEHAADRSAQLAAQADRLAAALAEFSATCTEYPTGIDAALADPLHDLARRDAELGAFVREVGAAFARADSDAHAAPLPGAADFGGIQATTPLDGSATVALQTFDPAVLRRLLAHTTALSPDLRASLTVLLEGYEEQAGQGLDLGTRMRVEQMLLDIQIALQHAADVRAAHTSHPDDASLPDAALVAPLGLPLVGGGTGAAAGGASVPPVLLVLGALAAMYAVVKGLEAAAPTPDAANAQAAQAVQAALIELEQRLYATSDALERYRLRKEAAARAERDRRLHELQQEAIDKGIFAKLPLDVQDMLNNDPHLNDLSFDPGNRDWRLNEGLAAQEAERQRTLKSPVERAVDDPNADFRDGDGAYWDLKAAKDGAEKIAEKAAGQVNGRQGELENILVDVTGLTADEVDDLQDKVAEELKKYPNHGKVEYVRRPGPPATP